MTALRLTVPAPSKRQAEEIDTRPGPFGEWLDYLPYANPRAAAEHLGEALSLLNRRPLATANRLELLELMQAPMQLLYEAYLGVSPDGTALNSHARDAKLGGLLQRLIVEVGFGYKRVVQEMDDHGLRRSGRKVAATALYRALRYLGAILQHAYMAYLPYPANVWRELYQLYAFTEEAKLLDTVVPDRFCNSAGSGSPARLFRQILLLALLDPYHMAEGRLWHALRYLQGVPDNGRLLWVTPDSDNHLGYFVVDLQSDSGPHPLGEEPLGRQERLFDTRDLVRGLRQQRESLAAAKGGVSPFATSLGEHDALQLLAYMQRHWTGKQERRSERIEESGRIEAAVGLDTAYHFIGGGPEPEPEPEPADDGDEDIDLGAATPRFQPARMAPPSLHRWHILNRSSGGLALSLPAADSGGISAGQLLALRAPAEPDNWTLAVGRWLMRGGGEREIQLGAQFLTRQASAARVRARIGNSGDTTLQAALLFEVQLRQEGRSLTAITPKGLFRHLRELLFFTDGGERRVECLRLLESGDAFDWFSYREVG